MTAASCSTLLLLQVLSLVASRFSWRPERLVLRRMKTINDIFQVQINIQGARDVGAVFEKLKKRYLKLIYRVENWYT